jgi:proteasome lid subunit RPN8/RPN11
VSEIKISHKDFSKIINYAKASYEAVKGEIGGMAIVTVTKDDDYLISNPVILKQEVTGSTCTLDKTSLANYYTKAMGSFGTSIKFLWWHSHANGSCFWSSTDEEAIKEYSGSTWSISLVVNIKSDYRLRIDWWKPVAVKLDKVDLEITGHTEKIPANIEAEVQKLVSEETTAVATTSPNGNLVNRNYTYYNGWGQRAVSYAEMYFTGEDAHLNWDMKYFHKRALIEAQEALESFSADVMGYLDMKGAFLKANEEIKAFGRIMIPRKGKLTAMLIKNPNFEVTDLFVKTIKVNESLLEGTAPQYTGC